MAKSTMTVDVTPDLSRLSAATRIVARHMTALADELDALTHANVTTGGRLTMTDAVDAAEKALRGYLEPWLGAVQHGTTLASQIRTAAALAVRDAAPHIAAAERDRMRALLPYHVGCCESFTASVADLINDHEDTSVPEGES